jgi:hypothetical protein
MEKVISLVESSTGILGLVLDVKIESILLFYVEYSTFKAKLQQIEKKGETNRNGKMKEKKKHEQRKEEKEGTTN